MKRPYSDRPAAPTVTVALRPHPASPASAVRAILLSARAFDDGSLAFAFRLSGETGQLRIPPEQPGTRADGLWQHTCFEVFIGTPEEAEYREFNFSPSGQWAAYAFSAPRERDPARDPQGAPQIAVELAADGLALDVVLPPAALPACAPGTTLPIGVAAVIEAADGTLSHWALQPLGDAPDFHRRDSFAMGLTLAGA